MIIRGDVIVFQYLGVVFQVCDIVEQSIDYIVCLEAIYPFLSWLGCKNPVEDGDQLFLMLGSGFHALESGVFLQILNT